ncbi:MAG: AMIN domain-containing protein, partial [Desulfomonilaceae bacterium]
MKFALARYIVPILACWFLIAAYSPVWGVEAANITSVQVAPDLKQITITCDRPIGRHSAFVIRQPFRLVVDLESTGLGNIPRRINVARNPLSEIRVGYANSRARVVVDFGEHPVPPFKVYEQNNSLVVCLGIGVAILPVSPARKPAVDVRRPMPQPKVTAVGPGARRADSSIVSVK